MQPRRSRSQRRRRDAGRHEGAGRLPAAAVSISVGRRTRRLWHGSSASPSTPHIFIFDQARTLQYDGRIDDDPTGARVTSPDARNAIEALLAGRPVPVKQRPVTGCAVKGLSAFRGCRLRSAERPIDEPVTVEMAAADDLHRLRQNGTGKLLLVNFWATWCAPCASEFPDLEATYRMYRARNLEFVTVSVNDPGERAAVLEFLQAHHASHTEPAVRDRLTSTACRRRSIRRCRRPCRSRCCSRPTATSCIRSSASWTRRSCAGRYWRIFRTTRAYPGHAGLLVHSRAMSEAAHERFNSIRRQRHRDVAYG